jgi:diguanylate cyclase (GGDEF)-like protein
VYPVEKAIGEINHGDYDSIILDISAGEDCAAAAESICKVSAYLPIIVLSHFENKFAAKALRKGAQQVISKSHLDSQFLSHTILSAIDRKNIENEIRMRDDILQAVNSAAEIFLTQSDWNLYLDEVLASLGKATRSDRVYVFSNKEGKPGETIAEFRAEWVAESVQVTKTATVIDGVDYKKDGFERWLKLMKNGQTIHGNVENLPVEEQPLLMKLGVKSFVYVPIFIDHTWWGFIGFDQCTHRSDWLQVEVEALKTAANILGAAISRQVTEEKLIYLATHDYLTDLPNRLLFEDRFHQAIARSDRSGKNFAMISIDMDKFKFVNDTHGHQMGDQVLIEVGKRLVNAIRGTDSCARIGGDEFAVIAEEIHNKGDVIRVMEKISNALQGSILIETKTISTSASMGASVYPLHGKGMEELMKAADKALYLVNGTTTRFKIYSDDQISWLRD